MVYVSWPLQGLKGAFQLLPEIRKDVRVEKKCAACSRSNCVDTVVEVPVQRDCAEPAQSPVEETEISLANSKQYSDWIAQNRELIDHWREKNTSYYDTDYIACNGPLEILKLAFDLKCSYNDNIGIYVTIANSLNMLQWLAQRVLICWKLCAYAAVDHGHLHIFKYIYSVCLDLADMMNDVLYNEWITLAIKNDHTHNAMDDCHGACLQWLGTS